MKRIAMMCAVVVLVMGTAALAAAGERGEAISKSTLSSMGLSALRPISSDAGAEIRGQGHIAFVFGSTNGIPLSSSTIHIGGGVLAFGFNASGSAGGGAFAFAK